MRVEIALFKIFRLISITCIIAAAASALAKDATDWSISDLQELADLQLKGTLAACEKDEKLSKQKRKLLAESIQNTHRLANQNSPLKAFELKFLEVTVLQIAGNPSACRRNFIQLINIHSLIEQRSKPRSVASEKVELAKAPKQMIDQQALDNLLNDTSTFGPNGYYAK